MSLAASRHGGPAAGPGPSSRRPIPIGRRWLYRFTAILLGLCLVGCAEGALWLLGVGRDLRLIVPLAQAPGWYQLNSEFDLPFFGQAGLSGPEPRPFQMPKPKSTRRILVVGGSTVIGFPYSSDLAFPRLLQEILQRQHAGGDRIEVLNAGITALNSSSEVAVVEEGLACDPDLIVVYTGHNEFYGPGGVASGAGQLDSVWFRRLARWKRWRLAQLLQRILIGRSAAPGDLMERLSADRNLVLNAPKFTQGLQRFEQNLRAMQDLGASQRVPVLFVGPVCNERDQPPLEPLPTPGSGAAEPAWQRDLREAEHWLRYDRPADARPLLESARASQPGSALVEFRLGQMSLQQNQPTTAGAHFRAAVEADGTRFRAPAAFREVMRRCAETRSGTFYCDLHRELTVRTDGSGLGRDLFFEHVHFNWHGNNSVAQVLARDIQQRLWQQPWRREAELTHEDLHQTLVVQPEEHLAALTLAMLVYEKPPFALAADAARLAKRCSEEVVVGLRELSASRREVFLDVSTQEMAADLLVALERRFRQQPSQADHLEVLRALVRRRPWLCAEREEWMRRAPRDVQSDLSREAVDWPCLPPSRNRDAPVRPQTRPTSGGLR